MALSRVHICFRDASCRLRAAFVLGCTDWTSSKASRREVQPALFSERYVDRMISYHAGIFRSLIAGGEIRDEDPDTLAWMYVSPVITLLSVCDRQPEREAESLEKLDAHVKLFFRTFNIERGEK